MKLLSIVIPAYNEEQSIVRSIPRITDVINTIPLSDYGIDDYEIIIVDDGSTDKTYERVVALKLEDRHFRIIKMRGNSGHMKALEAGLKASRGEFVVSIDADLQEPPEAIPEMIAILFGNPSLDYVQAARSNRSQDTYFKRKTAAIYYNLIQRATGVAVIPHAADYRIIRRSCLNEILLLPEKQKVFRLLLPKLKMKVQVVDVVRTEREFDQSKYNFRTMSKLAINSLLGFSSRPLRFIALLGSVMSALFLIGAIATVYIWINFKTIPGWTSIALLILLTQAVNIVCLSIIAEYISRIFTQVIDRPAFNYSEET